MTVPDRMGDFENAHALLFHLLNHTASDVLDEIWPDNEITIDEIAGIVLARHSDELAAAQIKYAREMNDPHGPYRTPVRMAALFGEVIRRDRPTT